MGTPPVVISDPAQLRVLAAPGGLSRAPPLVLALPQLTPVEAFTTAERMTRLAQECGCTHGALAMSAGSALLLAWLVVDHGFSPLPLLRHLLLLIPVALLSAGAGKAAGLLIARWRWRRELQALLQLVEARIEGR
jgi:hypothetical protein